VGRLPALLQSPPLLVAEDADEGSCLVHAGRIRPLLDSKTVSNEPALASIKAIANAPAKFSLDSLVLENALTGFATDALEVLSTAPRFATLKKLSLRYNELTADDIRLLLASETLPRSLDIDLFGNYFSSSDFAGALAERFGSEFDGEDDEDWG
ncbi:MAG TPA: hypothetical protein VGE74_19330, partial [Gemmata sp.]